jgi:cyclic pyranopterin phosphate synthase
MVDVGDKAVTARTARACGTIVLGEAAFGALRQGTCVKGDVLATAKVAAIGAVKSTPALIPMCHPILIEGVDVEFDLNEADKSVAVTVTVRSSGKTGVEMEALTGVAVGCLTIYDMLKYTGKAMTIGQIMLVEKTGGKSGDYKRQN